MGQCFSWSAPPKRQRRRYPFAAAYRSNAFAQPYPQTVTPIYPRSPHFRGHFPSTLNPLPAAPAAYNPQLPPASPWPWAATPRTPVASWNIPPTIVINPQLSTQRNRHPFLDWDTSQPASNATARYGAVTHPLNNYHLGQTATSPPLSSMIVSLTSTAPAFPPRPIQAATNLNWPWDTIHIERSDGAALRVGDVLHAIFRHLAKDLSHRELVAMSGEEWDRVDRNFRARVAVARARGYMGELRMARVDFLDGHCKYDGLEYADGEFLLSLTA